MVCDFPVPGGPYTDSIVLSSRFFITSSCESLKDKGVIAAKSLLLFSFIILDALLPCMYSSFTRDNAVSLKIPDGFSAICINSYKTPAVTSGLLVSIIALLFVKTTLSAFSFGFGLSASISSIVSSRFS